MLSVRPRSAAVAGLVLLAAATPAACSGSHGDKAGGGDSRTIVLTIATQEPNDAWVNFAAAVATESAGRVRLAPRIGWRAGDADFERATIADVRRGAVDLAEVGAGVWDTVGVTSFRALVAPLLIVDMDGQRRVLGSPLAREMLEGVRPLGLVGLAVLPGELRRPLGVTRPLLASKDYEGTPIASRVGRLGREAWLALGARPVAAADRARIAGMETDLATIDANRLDLRGGVLTADVVLWPRVRTIVIGRRAFEKLTAEQREALRRAASTALEPAFRRVVGDEVRSLARICRRGRLRLVRAGLGGLDALAEKVRPVYARLERDPRVRAHVDAIRRLGSSGSSSPAALECSAIVTGRAAPSPLDGTWRMTVTREELIRLGTPPIEADGVRGSWTYTVHDGRFEIRNHELGHVWSGRAMVDSRTITIVVDRCPAAFRPGCSPGEAYQHRWSLYRDIVTFSGLPGSTHVPIFVVKAWTRE